MAASKRSEETRRKLLGHAIERFAAVGYQAASVAEICRMSGMSTTAAYPYFRSKEELFGTAVDADADGLIRDALGPLLDGELIDDWVDVFSRLLAALDDHPLARRVLRGDEGRGAERLLVLPAEAALRDGLATALRNGQRDGTIRADIDPTRIAIGLVTLSIAVLIATLQAGGTADGKRVSGVVAVLEAATLRPSTEGR